MSSQATFRALLLAFACLVACGQNRARIEASPLPKPAARPTGRPDAGLAERPPSSLMLVGLKPPHGPFSGGNEVVLRGSGFRVDALVAVGDSTVPATESALEDENRLRVRVPKGAPGLVDVRVRIGSTEVVLADAYTYDPIALTPNEGSIAGGTRIEVEAYDDLFQAGDRVLVGGSECTAPTLASARSLRCTTSAHAAGSAEVRVERAGTAPIVVSDAFRYVDSAEEVTGGLGGGPLEGALDVLVIDDYSDEVVPSATVIVEHEDGVLRGLTNAQGRVTVSIDALRGPVTLHVIKRCYEHASFVSFDARFATVRLRPWSLAACAGSMPMVELDAGLLPSSPPSSPGGVGQLASMIAGQLVWKGANEFGPNPWDNVPTPKADEQRVAYVFTSQLRADLSNPAPNATSNTRFRVTEADVASHGYAYRIVARADGLAVYAIAGLERAGRFVPYVMGVRRGVLLAPGQELKDIDVTMDLPLDHGVEIGIVGAPQPTLRGPDHLDARLTLELGSDGVIVRRLNGASLDERSLEVGTSRVTFAALPPLTGPLADARFDLFSRYSSGADLGLPFSFTRTSGLREDQVTTIGPFLAIPQATLPGEGALLEGRTFRFLYEGPTPDFFALTLADRTRTPVWRVVLPGTARSVILPDPSADTGGFDIPSGGLLWSVIAGRGTAVDYDAWTYSLLRERNLVQASGDSWSFLK